MQVSIVLHEPSQDIADQLAQRGPIWLHQSAINARTAASLRAASVEPDHVTLFTSPAGSSAEQSALYILDTVLLHHPTWTELIFMGLRDGTSVHAALQSDYACELTEAPDRIVINRSK